MDLLSPLMLAAALSTQAPPAAAPPPALDPDALCVAAILPGHMVLMSVSSSTPDMGHQIRREEIALAYYLGALRSRIGDPVRVNAEITAALRSFRPHGPDFRFEKSNACVEAASRLSYDLYSAFPPHRLNAEIGDRSAGRER